MLKNLNELEEKVELLEAKVRCMEDMQGIENCHGYMAERFRNAVYPYILKVMEIQSRQQERKTKTKNKGGI